MSAKAMPTLRLSDNFTQLTINQNFVCGLCASVVQSFVIRGIRAIRG